MSSAVTTPTICIAEDRASLEPAVRLLLASLSEHCPTFRVEVFYPSAAPAFLAWSRKFPRVVVHMKPVDGRYSKYDVKPYALLALLDRGVRDIIWVDSDIIVGAGFEDLFKDLTPRTVVLTEETLGQFHDDPNGLRCRLWGMPVGRTLPFCLNTCVMRVTEHHRGLLERWRSLLARPEYRDAQEADWSNRGVHCMGDQDVATALLASAEFADVPLKLLRRRQHILQYFGLYGYTVGERLFHLRHGMPPIIHSMGHKPWWPVDEERRGGYARFMNLYLQVSPYTRRARHYEQELASAEWLRPTPQLLAGTLRVLSFGSIPLFGLPMAAAADLLRLAKHLSRKLVPHRAN